MLVISGEEQPSSETKSSESVDGENVVGKLPLKNTSVQAEISGFVGRTTVVQTFQNPYSTPIEALYRFPLPSNASVDSMVMEIGEKKIIGKIEQRKKAEELYEQAKNEGKTAALLNQERPNVFTQKVANILPGEEIRITISYFETIHYEDGKYSYVFPMVVGPRYSLDSVSDAENLRSPNISPDARDGHNIDLKLSIHAGVNISKLNSSSHDVDIKKVDDSQVVVSLKNKDEIPNRDFSFTYDVAGKEPQIGVLLHKDATSDHGYFTLLAEPQKEVAADDIRNKEIIFVLDTSGSMGGAPIESVKKAMIKAINNLGENDYINVYSFNNGVEKLFEESQKSSATVKEQALEFVNHLSAGGGTVMDEPFKEALKDTGDYEDRMRIILIMTDGDIGNESEILSIIQKNLGKNRVFTFGVDASPNRYLLDSISEAGRGKTTYILEKDSIDEKVDEFYNTFKSPILTDIVINWGGIKVFDLLPEKIPDLYAGEPINITGKYSGTMFHGLDTQREIVITGKRGNKDYSQKITVSFPQDQSENQSLAGLWARQKIKQIYQENYYTPNSKLEEEVTALGLQYAIMTEYTSFIAIDDEKRTSPNNTQTVEVPTYQVSGKDSSPGSISSTSNFGLSKGMNIRTMGARDISALEGNSASDGSDMIPQLIQSSITLFLIIFLPIIFIWLRRRYKARK